MNDRKSLSKRIWHRWPGRVACAIALALLAGGSGSSAISAGLPALPAVVSADVGVVTLTVVGPARAGVAGLEFQVEHPAGGEAALEGIALPPALGMAVADYRLDAPSGVARLVLVSSQTLPAGGNVLKLQFATSGGECVAGPVRIGSARAYDLLGHELAPDPTAGDVEPTLAGDYTGDGLIDLADLQAVREAQEAGHADVVALAEVGANWGKICSSR